MHKANREVRDRMDSLRLRYWEVAREIGILPQTFSVWLRTDLSPERRARVDAAIDALIGK